MALFKCNQSGTVVEFRDDYDIKTMKTNPEYTEVDTSAAIEVVKVDETKQTLTLKKPMGRPRKELLV